MLGINAEIVKLDNRSMTTATKLSLGFGALILLLVISNLAIILPLQSVDGEIRVMSEVGRPRRAAT